MKTAQLVLRTLLTLTLLYLSYTETGIYTTLILTLIAIKIEAEGFLRRRSLK
jgi:hypothetical protein